MHERFLFYTKTHANYEYWAVFHCNLSLATGITGSKSGACV